MKLLDKLRFTSSESLDQLSFRSHFPKSLTRFLPQVFVNFMRMYSVSLVQKSFEGSVYVPRIVSSSTD